MDIAINFWLVLGVAILSMAIGAFWYSPKLFANVWVAGAGLTAEKLAGMKSKGMGKSYVIAFIGNLIMAYVLAHIVGLMSLVTFGQGAQLGFWLWLGLVVPAQAGMVLWEGKTWRYYFVNIGYHLVTLVLAGGLLATLG